VPLSRRSILASLVGVSLAAAAGAALMHRTQTVIDVPAAGEDVALSALSYKANAFEAKIGGVRIEPKSADGADPVQVDWRFVGSNSDGQQHRVDIFVRLLDESGKQIETFDKSFFLVAGAHEQVCAVPMRVSAEHWKRAKSARIVTDWLS